MTLPLPLRLDELLAGRGSAHFCHRLHNYGFCILWMEASGQFVPDLGSTIAHFFTLGAEEKEATLISQGIPACERSEPAGYLRLFDFELLQIRKGHEPEGPWDGGLCGLQATITAAFDFFHDTGMLASRVDHTSTKAAKSDSSTIQEYHCFESCSSTGSRSPSLARQRT
jgi:hypothetical protein